MSSLGIFFIVVLGLGVLTVFGLWAFGGPAKSSEPAGGGPIISPGGSLNGSADRGDEFARGATDQEGGVSLSEADNNLAVEGSVGAGAGDAPGIDVALPDDVPHRGWLQSAGIETMNDLLQVDNLAEEVKYIGPERAADIQEYLATEVETFGGPNC